MKRHLLVLALAIVAVAIMAFSTSPTGILLPPDAETMPQYRILKSDSVHNHAYMRLCKDSGQTSTDGLGQTINWGNICAHQGFTRSPWDSSKNYIWLENNASQTYSKRLLLGADGALIRGKCGLAALNETAFPTSNSDSVWHNSASYPNVRIVVQKLSGVYYLRWWDVLGVGEGCQVLHSENAYPLTGANRISGMPDWTLIHGIGNFEGNMDSSGRYLALNGCNGSTCLDDPGTSSNDHTFEMVVLDIGTSPSTTPTVSNMVDLCTDWPAGSTCLGLGSSAGTTTMSPDGKFVVVRYEGPNHTRVYNYEPSGGADICSGVDRLCVRDLRTGSSDDTIDCACWDDPSTPTDITDDICITGERDKGFAPWSDHMDVGVNGYDSDIAVVAGQRQGSTSECDGGTDDYDQSSDKQVGVVMFRLSDGHVYARLLSTAVNDMASVGHVSLRGHPNWITVTFENTNDPDGQYEQEVAAIRMDSVGTGADTVERYVHHHSEILGSTYNPNYGDEDEVQAVSRRGDGLRQIWTSHWHRDCGGCADPGVVYTFFSRVPSGGGGGGGCANCAACVCDEGE